jgi:hypothetical protein
MPNAPNESGVVGFLVPFGVGMILFVVISYFLFA